MARYHIINDHNVARCDDHNCERYHVNILTNDDLTARDNDNYDAGYSAGYKHSDQQARHAANVGWPAIDAHLAKHGWGDDHHGTARRFAGRGRYGYSTPGASAVTWARWEDEFDGGGNEAESGIDPVAAIVWSLTLVVGLAFWTAVGVIAWNLAT